MSFFSDVLSVTRYDFLQTVEDILLRVDYTDIRNWLYHRPSFNFRVTLPILASNAGTYSRHILSGHSSFTLPDPDNGSI